MATAMAERPRQAHTQTSNGNSALDAAVNETEHRRKTLTAGAATVLGVRPDQVCSLLRNVWTTTKGTNPLTDQEMFAGISMIARFELDPIAKEIYVTRAKDGRLMTVVGVDGWVKILDRTDHYDGFEQEYHETTSGEIDWIETRIFSTKRSKPTVYRAYMKEYRAISGFIAGKIPVHMLSIFSLRHAARRFVPLGGHVVTEEEAHYMATGDVQGDANKGKTIDDIADALMKPVLQHPSEPEAPDSEPTLDEHFAAFQSELLAVGANQDERQGVWDKWFGKDSAIPWPNEYHARADELFSVQPQPAKAKKNQGKMFETTPTAQEQGH